MWLTASVEEALKLRWPPASGILSIVARGAKNDASAIHVPLTVSVK